MILFMGLAGIVTYSLLLWTKSFFGAQLLEVTYAAYSTSEVAYFAYIYAKVSKEHYSAVTSHTRAGLLIGRFISGVLSQSLIHFKLMKIDELNYITLSAQIVATIFAISLPSVKESIYFYRRNSKSTAIEADNLGNGLPNAFPQSNTKQAFALMWSQFKCAYSNRQILLWSIWYAFGLCGFLQVLTYVQMLWIEIDNRPEVMWNGAVEAIATLLSATIALLASRLHTNVLNSKIKILLVLFIMSIFASGAIVLLANTSSRLISYIGYMMFYLFYTFTITISR